MPVSREDTDSLTSGSIQTIFQGSLADMPVVGLLQSLELGNKSAAVHIRADGRDGLIHVQRGAPVDAWFGQSTGDEAVLRMLDARKGTFRVEFGEPFHAAPTISTPLTALLLEGARRSDLRVRLEPKLPPPKVPLESVATDVDTYDPVALEVLATCNGQVTRDDVVDASINALKTYEALARLWEEGSVRAVEDTPFDDEEESRSHPVFPAQVTAQLRALRDQQALESPESRRPSPSWRVPVLVVATATVLVGLGVAWALPPNEPAAADPDVSVAAVASDETPASAISCPPGMVAVAAGEAVAAFCIDRFEVKVSDYRECVDRGTCSKAHGTSEYPRREMGAWEWDREKRIYTKLCNAPRSGRDDHPVNCVTWTQADAYCTWLGRSLPTEQQWEQAAGRDRGFVYAWGEEPVDPRRGNFCGPECRQWLQSRGLSAAGVAFETSDRFPGTAPVGSFPEGVSPFDVHDLGGNVFEWTSTTQGVDYVARGGAFDSDDPRDARIATRVVLPRDAHPHSVGFRCIAEAR